MNTFIMTHQMHIGNNFVTQNAQNVVVWLSKGQAWVYFWCNSRAQTNLLDSNDSKSIRSKQWIHSSWLIKCILGITVAHRMTKILRFDSTNGKHGGIFGAIPGHKVTYWGRTQKVSGLSHEYIHHDSSNAYWEQLCHTECPKFGGWTLEMENMGVFLVQFQGTN